MNLQGYVIHAVYEDSVPIGFGTEEKWLRVFVIQQPTNSSVYIFETEEAAHAYAKSEMYKNYELSIVGYDVRPLYGKKKR